MAIPAMEPATPLKELSREMVMGMSAPPMRMANAMPKKPLMARGTTINRRGERPSTAAAPTQTAEATKEMVVIAWWAGHTMDF